MANSLIAPRLKTPGVYIEEISLFPPSVAQVETAIPAFIGYTEKATHKKANDLFLKPKRIVSMLEFENFFGTTPTERLSIDVNLNDSNKSFQLTPGVNPVLKFNLHYAMKMFFANGGGPCYIVPVGNFSATEVEKKSLLAGLAEVEKEDEVTIILSPDAASLDEEDYGDWIDACLTQCNQLQDRFTVADVNDDYLDNNEVTLHFRDKIANETEFVKYGAAYFPYLETTLSYQTLVPGAGTSAVMVRNYTKNGNSVNAALALASKNAFDAFIAAEKAYLAALKEAEEKNRLQNVATKIQAAVTASAAITNDVAEIIDAAKRAAGKDTLKDTLPNDNAILNAADETAVLAAVGTYLTAATNANTAAQTALTTAKTAMDTASTTWETAMGAGIAVHEYSYILIDRIKLLNNALYKQLLTFADKQRVILPPSSTVAGKYAQVDSNRGVWKAPANVSLSNVVGPTVIVSHGFNGDLNITDTGKSVNVIRAFVGQGTKIWGARTLAGNDNEWRYISVRRFFNMVEESVKKATAQFVFEPNDKNTWVRVKSMIDNFLTLQWRAGALAGAVPDQAFYVKVGLNETMTALDILEGRMIVEIGMAVVRPAEFIILQFMHKMQES